MSFITPRLCSNALDGLNQIVYLFPPRARVDVTRTDGKGTIDLSARWNMMVLGV
jgi:hypothetical protein